MKQVIVYYSKTANTESVAKKLKAKLASDCLAIKAESDDPNQTNVKLIEIPSIKENDRIIFGSPVHGFSIPKITKAYLAQLGDLTGKTFDLFVTHHFPFAWLGGNQTLKAMKKVIEKKQGKVEKMISINWKSKKREQDISNFVNMY
jgi:flavodoxin